MARRAKLQLVPSHAGKGKAREAGPATGGKAKAREGTRVVAAHVPAALWKEITHLRAELSTTVQALVTEALEDLLAKHRR
jgi:hypothetical protein